MKRSSLFLAMLLILTLGLYALPYAPGTAMELGKDLKDRKPIEYPVATLGGGCFWCVESEFRALDGILYTRVGYMGGALENPAYEDITTGKTGHAEVVEITYDPEIVSYEELLTFFLTKAHDPTQLNRQGVDVGPQYRSAIFYHDEAQKASAQEVTARLSAENVFDEEIVTEISPASTFWMAEDYHQQYYEKYEAQTGRTHIRVMMKKAGKLN